MTTTLHATLALAILAFLVTGCEDEIQIIDSPYAIIYSLDDDRVVFDPSGTIYFRMATDLTSRSFALHEQTHAGFWFEDVATRIDGSFAKAGIHEGTAHGFIPGGAHGCPEYQLYELTLAFAADGTTSTWQGEAPGCD